MAEILEAFVDELECLTFDLSGGPKGRPLEGMVRRRTGGSAASSLGGAREGCDSGPAATLRLFIHADDCAPRYVSAEDERSQMKAAHGQACVR